MSELWRVGAHYRIHVYEQDRPVATFHNAEDAKRAVEAVNALGERRAEAEAALAAERAKVAAVQRRHYRLRTALALVHVGRDGVTGRCMVDAEDLLEILNKDADSETNR